MKIRMICGYKGHGKDTLTRELTTGHFEYPVSIYANPNQRLPFPDGKGFRVALADELKKEVKRDLGLPNDFDIEKQKEDIIQDGKTFRSFCIKRAKERRDQNIYHWSHLAFEYIKRIDLPGIPTFSDNRNPDEIEYYTRFATNVDVITIRIFRQEAPIPDLDDISEHGMDQITTDFVVVPLSNHTEQFETVNKIFPQYSDYVCVSYR